MQMDIFKRQQEQQEKLIDRLLDKEKELLRHQNSLQEIIDTSVDDSKAQNEDQNTPDTQEEKPPINADMNKYDKYCMFVYVVYHHSNLLYLLH